MIYKVKNGTSYSSKASDKCIAALERARLNSKRIRVWYGDNVTGVSWHEEYDIVGTIGRSTGLHKIPLLINNSRSIGGGALLDSCIVCMIDTKTKKVLYSHKLFKMPMAIVQDRYQTDFSRTISKDYTHCVKINGQQHAFFKSESKAKRYADFMSGKRMGK